uniref:Uncharacterized protein n=1 Tax=Branchiostoma floridae TaxID=7739 RepID=C3XTL8_BRAFL|eukprot:XP_002612635.1 hypothetical protein BRAFLDRAFT_78736 [Branchiostoma floridae]
MVIARFYCVVSLVEPKYAEPVGKGLIPCPATRSGSRQQSCSGTGQGEAAGPRCGHAPGRGTTGAETTRAGRAGIGMQRVGGTCPESATGNICWCWGQNLFNLGQICRAVREGLLNNLIHLEQTPKHPVLKKEEKKRSEIHKSFGR